MYKFITLGWLDEDFLLNLVSESTVLNLNVSRDKTLNKQSIDTFTPVSWQERHDPTTQKYGYWPWSNNPNRWSDINYLSKQVKIAYDPPTGIEGH